jgi:hypothetical protein
MKKHFTFIFALTLFVLTSCKNDKPKEGTDKNVSDSTSTKTESEETKSNTKALEKGKFPFEFPVVEKLNAAKGDKVFAVNMKLVMNDYNAGKTTIGTQYLLSTVEEPGEKESKINFVSADVIPNSGIVVIPKGQTAKVGDIVAGKWAVNLTRGIVTDASNPKSPKVTFIGLSYDNPAKADDKKTGIGQYQYTLTENEFMIISKDFDPGSCCAVKKDGKWSLMDVFKAEGDMVMGTIFTEFTAVKKSDCIAIPLKGNFKVGDQVYAPWVGKMSVGKITKIDSKMGRITVKFDDKVKGEKVVSFGQVIKDLPKS